MNKVKVNTEPFNLDFMCRILGYLGQPLLLQTLLAEPEHSLVVQSYRPQEMTSGVVNADGYGIGWYHPEQETEPFIYKNLLPIWGDVNFSHLCRYIRSGVVLANVRSATPGLGTDFSNSQPFTHRNWLFTHNGFIQNFRQTLYRPMRQLLKDEVYQKIQGTTDSEHIFGLILNHLITSPQVSLQSVLAESLNQLSQLAETYQTQFSANLMLTDGKSLVASRFSSQSPAPSLYWLQDEKLYPNAVVVASEPLQSGHWITVPENTLLRIEQNLDQSLDVTLHSL